MSFFKKDKDDTKKNTSFSNVTSGSSTAGEGQRAPSPPPMPSAVRGAKPDFSNVRSGGSSTAPTLGGASTTSYVVQGGDSLSKIAKRIYGDAKKWTRIYEANLALIGKNPDLIHPGQTLVIPQD